MTDSPISPWYAEHRQVLDFARILAAAAVLTSATDALDYLDKPQHFNAEHTLWIQLARPQQPYADDLDEARLLGNTSSRATALRQQHTATAATWDTFCVLLDELNHTGRPLRLVDSGGQPAPRQPV